MTAAYLRSRYARLTAAGLCIVCEAKAFDNVRCPSCHAWHLDNERRRKPAKGIYACTLCRQKGHNAATCQQTERAA